VPRISIWLTFFTSLRGALLLTSSISSVPLFGGRKAGLLSACLTPRWVLNRTLFNSTLSFNMAFWLSTGIQTLAPPGGSPLHLLLACQAAGRRPFRTDVLTSGADHLTHPATRASPRRAFYARFLRVPFHRAYLGFGRRHCVARTCALPSCPFTQGGFSHAPSHTNAHSTPAHPPCHGPLLHHTHAHTPCHFLSLSLPTHTSAFMHGIPATPLALVHDTNSTRCCFGWVPAFLDHSGFAILESGILPALQAWVNTTWVLYQACRHTAATPPTPPAALLLLASLQLRLVGSHYPVGVACRHSLLQGHVAPVVSLTFSCLPLPQLLQHSSLATHVLPRLPPLAGAQRSRHLLLPSYDAAGISDVTLTTHAAGTSAVPQPIGSHSSAETL